MAHAAEALPLEPSEQGYHEEHLASFLNAGHAIRTNRQGAYCTRCLERVPWSKIEDLGQPCSMSGMGAALLIAAPDRDILDLDARAAQLCC